MSISCKRFGPIPGALDPMQSKGLVSEPLIKFHTAFVHLDQKAFCEEDSLLILLDFDQEEIKSKAM